MPFDEEDELEPNPIQKIGLKQISSQKSIFENNPKKPSVESFDHTVKEYQNKSSNNKIRISELALLFNKSMADKTLKSNKTIFANEIEQDLLSRMIQLAIEINADTSEHEGMGSLGWITLLLKTCFSQRDKINNLEYAISKIERQINGKKDNEL